MTQPEEAELQVRSIDPLPILNDLLDRRYELGGADENTPIGRLANQMLYFVINREIQFGYMVQTQLRLLAQNLTEVRDANPAAYVDLRNRIRDADSMDAFEAARFELNIAARLARSAVLFLKTEAPDFSLKNDHETYGIECTSVHVVYGHRDDISYKIEATALKKSKKGYCTGATALFIDATEYFHRGIARETLQSDDGLRSLLRNTLDRYAFGSLCLFVFVWRWHGSYGELTQQHLRQDGQSIAPTLRRMLDAYWPFGHEVLSNFAIPGNG